MAAAVAAPPPPPQLPQLPPPPPPPLQLRAPGPRVAAPIPREMPDSYRRKKRRRERGLGRKPAGLAAAAAAPPPASTRAQPRPPATSRASSGLQVPPPPPPPAPRTLQSLGARAKDAPGAGLADCVGTPYIGPLHPSLLLPPHLDPDGGNLRTPFSPPPTHLETWREGRPYPPGPPGYGPARSLTPARSLSVCRRTGAWARHVRGHLKISLTEGA